MIRTDNERQWASTQMAIQDATPTTPAKWPLEEGRKQTGLDYQGRNPEAAHAASEETDDDRPVPGAGPVVWLAVSVVALFAALGAWHMLAWWRLP